MQSQNTDLLLIYPPIAKAAEPPAGVAQIKQALQSNGLTCRVIDANIEGQLFLINAAESDSPRIKSAIRNRSRNLSVIRDITAYKKFDHYKRSVIETNRLLGAAGSPFGASVTLTDFKQQGLTPVRSEDLLKAALTPQDNPFYRYFREQLARRIQEASPGVIGISLVYLSQALTAFALVGFIKRMFPGVKLILGGGLVTSWMQQPQWRNPFDGLFDDIISGRGERPILSMFGADAAKSFYPPSYDVDDATYLSPGRIIPYTTSYGCYWKKCTFCPEVAEGNAFEPTPHPQVFSDLEELSRPAPSLIHFLDNALSPALLKKMARRSLPAPWYGYVRFTAELEDEDFCLALRKSGCVLLQLGLESGDQGVLDDMRKGIELHRVSRILRNLHTAGIAAFIYLLFGTPYETEEQARRTIKFVLDHADCIQYINAAIFNMPVFSEESDNHATHHFYRGDLSLYHDFDHPKGWHRPKVRRFLQKEFQAHPVIKKILYANPPAFTSNHAPFFTDHFI